MSMIARDSQGHAPFRACTWAGFAVDGGDGKRDAEEKLRVGGSRGHVQAGGEAGAATDEAAERRYSQQPPDLAGGVADRGIRARLGAPEQRRLTVRWLQVGN